MSKLRVHRRGSVSTPKDSATNLLPRFGGDDPLKEPESVTRYRQFLAGPHVCVDTALKGLSNSNISAERDVCLHFFLCK